MDDPVLVGVIYIVVSLVCVSFIFEKYLYFQYLIDYAQLPHNSGHFFAGKAQEKQREFFTFKK